METVFTEQAIREIAGALQCDWKLRGNNYRLTLEQPLGGRKLALEIYPDIKIGEKIGNLISVYTVNTHLQLHFCTGYVISEMLGEVTFISQQGGFVSGLVIEREVGCSLYANVDRSVLSGDFTQMGPEVMMSGISLSLVEHVLHSNVA
ncbi:MAG: hypothetical protein ONB16_10410 [candidate division KSB1 bacterium]|nr:hypothetical protein [candidate division KSB1 bacterium]MDZ7318137.1 hypothetical protein [candidate division KSB1 bacterium]MDZ7341843.1 hypothetical protein [candidate division KSB1 bacterium]